MVEASDAPEILSNMSIRVREAVQDDLGLIQGLEQEFPPPASGQRSPWEADEFRMMLENSRAMKLTPVVADVDGAAVGYGMTGGRRSTHVGLDNASDSRVLTHVAVQPEYRGRGAGSAIVTALVDKARNDGCSLILAHVREQLKSFYEELGWTVTSVRTGLAWIEAPTHRVWEEARSQGFDVGPRRKSSLLRFDTPEEDSQYSCIAYQVLAAERMSLLYEFPVPVGGRSDMELAWGYLAFMCLDDVRVYAALPADVSRTVYEFVRGIRGAEEADQLARTRR